MYDLKEVMVITETRVWARGRRGDGGDRGDDDPRTASRTEDLGENVVAGGCQKADAEAHTSQARCCGDIPRQLNPDASDREEGGVRRIRNLSPD